MKRLLIVATFSLLVAARIVAEPELKGSPGELSGYLSTLPKMVRLTGEGEAKAQADRAIVSLKVSVENKQLQDALRGNEEIRGRVAAFLKDNGISADRVQAARFASTQKQGVFSEKAKSHRVESFLKVTVRDDKEFQAVASTVDRFPEVHYLGIDFEHSDTEALKMKATVAACENAGARQKVFEDQLGVKLVPRGFSESVAPASRVPVGVGAQGGSAPSSLLGKSDSDYRSQPAIATEPVSVFGELVYRAQVAIEYSVQGR